MVVRALMRENGVRFPGRVAAIVRNCTPWRDRLGQLADARRIHRENVHRILSEPAFASWIADGSTR